MHLLETAGVIPCNLTEKVDTACVQVLYLKVPLQVMWIDKHHGTFIDSRSIVTHTAVPDDMNRCVLLENKSL